ncbi:PSD1 and planctomycete cytochrome C domain-containing protein [Lignipirellula cremea]|nr:PSD1 and planctomycete cytochrome C domain-containing protein [Lignipirellula cremea]
MRPVTVGQRRTAPDSRLSLRERTRTFAERKSTFCVCDFAQRQNRNHQVIFLAFLACLLVGCFCLLGPATAAAEEPAQPTANKATPSADFFREQVQPILTQHCNACHGPESDLKGGLYLGSRQGLLTGGETGPAVDLQKPDSSLLLEAINYRTYEMPPKKKLSDAQIAVLTQWVKQDLPYPADAESPRPQPAEPNHQTEVTEQAKQYWAFQPPSRPAVPQVENAAWPSSPLDHFILARLEQAGIPPAAPADKRSLIRRATYDLTGLPPTQAEVQAFLADDSPEAFATVIDRLLDSPHYGERWGRHWLDLVRYAETNSYERDGDKPHAWRFRDYVIQSFNDDKPYTQFLKEQLAGDEMEPKTPESIVATGYYRLGIWDDEPVSQKQAFYDDLDDIVLTTSQVFLGLTVNCARCHDHKIDPIPQADYYRFLAFFRGVKRYGERSHPSVLDASVGPIAVNAEQEQAAEQAKRLNGELQGVQRKIGDVERKLHELLTPPEKEDFRAVEVRLDLARKYIGKGLSRQLVDDYAAALKRRQEIEANRPAAIAQALVVKEGGSTPPETFILVRGNAEVEGAKAEPGFPSILSPPEPHITPPASGRSSGRRTALADWIASEQNPLTARVMANRIWQHHFGRGIVRSSNNFGHIGDRPTHPQLLDWLATELVAGDWKLKSLHKKIMLSSTYRMGVHGSAVGLERDPANNLFGRFDSRRLTAEELRDSMLSANGSLNLKMGGPSIYPLIPAEVLAGQSRPGSGWGNSSPEERARRAVYIFIKRSLVEPIMADFDFADVDSTCPVRFVTTQPTQALALLNSEFAHRQAEVFARDLEESAGDDPSRQIALCLQRVTQRKPEPHEVARGVKYLESLQQDGLSPQEALRHFCLLAYNLNEFLYLD